MIGTNGSADGDAGVMAALCLDLDGILWGWEGRIPTETRDALRNLSDRGITLLVNTGRSATNAIEVLRDRRIDVYDYGFRAIVSDQQMIHIVADDDLVAVAAWNDDRARRFRDRYGMAYTSLAEAKRYFAGRGLDGRWVLTGDEAYERCMVSIVFPTAMEADLVRHHVSVALQDGAPDLMCDRNLGQVCVMAADGGKGRALKHAAHILDLAPGSILCVGDSYADLSMLDGALGFAAATVMNAEPEVRAAVEAAGGYVSPGFCGVGLLDILRRFFPATRGHGT